MTHLRLLALGLVLLGLHNRVDQTPEDGVSGYSAYGLCGGVPQPGQYWSLLGNQRQLLGSQPLQAQSQVVDLLEAVICQQVCEVCFSALPLTSVGDPFEDLQSCLLLNVLDV